MEFGVDIPVHAKVEATSSPSYSASGQTVPVSPSSPGASSTSNDARFFWFLISSWFGIIFLCTTLTFLNFILIGE